MFYTFPFYKYGFEDNWGEGTPPPLGYVSVYCKAYFSPEYRNEILLKPLDRGTPTIFSKPHSNARETLIKLVCVPGDHNLLAGQVRERANFILTVSHQINL